MDEALDIAKYLGFYVEYGRSRGLADSEIFHGKDHIQKGRVLLTSRKNKDGYYIQWSIGVDPGKKEVVSALVTHEWLDEQYFVSMLSNVVNKQDTHYVNFARSATEVFAFMVFNKKPGEFEYSIKTGKDISAGSIVSNPEEVENVIRKVVDLYAELGF